MDSTTVGRAPKASAPLLWRWPKAASILVNGEIGGSVYGTIYPTMSGSKNGAEIDMFLPGGLLTYLKYNGTLIEYSPKPPKHPVGAPDGGFSGCINEFDMAVAHFRMFFSLPRIS